MEINFKQIIIIMSGRVSEEELFLLMNLVRRDSGCALMKSPAIGRNDCPVLPGLPW